VYKRSVTGVLQICVELEEGKEMLVEIHQGECRHHASSRALVAKVFRHGFYWPTALENAEDLVRKCNGCQRYAKQNHTPTSGLKTIPLTWPFAVWCLDMVGPFKTARGNMTHMLVMVDKFTKGNVVIMPHQELWLPKCSSMEFTGPLLWKTPRTRSGSAMYAKDRASKTTP
jgi:hypothetical protein